MKFDLKEYYYKYYKLKFDEMITLILNVVKVKELKDWKDIDIQ